MIETQQRPDACPTILLHPADNVLIARTLIELGAKLDGVLRSHQANPHPDAKGSLRDTCVYSVIAPEWPTVRAHLSYQLSKPREPMAGA